MQGVNVFVFIYIILKMLWSQCILHILNIKIKLKNCFSNKCRFKSMLIPFFHSSLFCILAILLFTLYGPILPHANWSHCIIFWLQIKNFCLKRLTLTKVLHDPIFSSKLFSLNWVSWDRWGEDCRWKASTLDSSSLILCLLVKMNLF